MYQVSSRSTPSRSRKCSNSSPDHRRLISGSKGHHATYHPMMYEHGLRLSSLVPTGSLHTLQARCETSNRSAMAWLGSKFRLTSTRRERAPSTPLIDVSMCSFLWDGAER